MQQLAYIVLGIILGVVLNYSTPLIVLLILVGLISVFIIFRDVNFGIIFIAVVAIFPSLARKVGPIIVPLVDVLLLIIMVPWGLRVLMYREKIRIPSLHHATGMLLSVMLLSIIVSTDKATSFKEILQFIIFAFFYTTVLFNNIQNVKIIRQMMNILTIGTGLMGSYAFIRFLQLGSTGLYILGLHKNALGGLMVLPLPYLYMKYLSTKKVGWLAIIFSNGIGLIVSLSRGAWVGGFVGCVLVAFLHGKKELLKMFSVLGIVVLILYLSVPTRYQEAAVSSHTLSEREAYWYYAISGFKAKPILGWGYGNFLNVARTYIGDRPTWLLAGDPHNVYLRFAAELGVLGLLAFSYLIYFIFFRAIKSIRDHPPSDKKDIIIGLTGSLAAYFAHGFFDVFWVRGTGSLFWIFLSLIFILIEKQDLVEEVPAT